MGFSTLDLLRLNYRSECKLESSCHCPDMWLVGVIVFFIFPISKPPFLVIKPAYLKVLHFLAFISPPPPLNLWSCSSRSVQSHTTSLCFSCGGGGEMSEWATPLTNPCSRLSTREQLRPIFPKYHTKRQSYRNYDTEPSPRPILTNQLHLDFQANKQQLIFCSSQRVISCPHRTVHQQNLPILSSRFQALPCSPSLAYCPSSSTLPLPHIQPS